VNLTWWQGLFLGLVQGLTEFLPISSSGHLVLAEELVGFRPQGVFFEVMVHVATLLSVIFAYRVRIAALGRGLFSGGQDARRYLAMLLLASVPAGLSGVLFKDYFERSFHSLGALSWQFFVTAGLLWSTKWAGQSRVGKLAVASDSQLPTPNSQLSTPNSQLICPSPIQAVILGIAQAFAIIPAISRSGATIAAGLWMGMPAVAAAEFSFLMSIIVIAGSGALEARHLVSGSQMVTPGLLAAFAAAMISGLLAIYFLVALLRRGKFHYFAPYCVAVGLLCLLWFAR
jgi:undecaprenyl-diphosphatase